MRMPAYAFTVLLACIGTLLFGCEQQDSPVRAADTPSEDAAPAGERVDSPGMPGTTGYYNALSGASSARMGTENHFRTP